MRKKHKHIGSSFEDFLKAEGIFEETTTQAVKRVLAWQVSETMKKKGISKIEMAKRMRTSRSQHCVSSLDHFVGSHEHQRWDRQAQSLGSPKIDNPLEFRRLFYW